MCTVYCAKCRCGIEYIGESHRNLKVKLAEHEKRNSDSAFTDHLFIDKKVHKIVPRQTLVLAQEKQSLKRKIVETLCIRTYEGNLCNTGPSVDLELAWDTCLDRVGRELRKRTRIDTSQGDD